MKDQIKPIENQEDLNKAKEHLDTIDISLEDKIGADGKKKRITNEYAKDKLESEAEDIKENVKNHEAEHSNKTNDTFKKAKPITNETELKAAKHQIEVLKEAMTKSISQSEMHKAVFHQSALLQEQQQLLELQRLVREYETKNKKK